MGPRTVRESRERVRATRLRTAREGLRFVASRGSLSTMQSSTSCFANGARTEYEQDFCERERLSSRTARERKAVSDLFART
eukprot:5519988-Alexandrium_andersonii.AAC.1